MTLTEKYLNEVWGKIKKISPLDVALVLIAIAAYCVILYLGGCPV